MTTSIETQDSNPGWLKTYYYLRFAVSTIWVAIAFTVGRSMPTLAAVMLVAYPTWDAIANYLDASRSGGLAKNKSQMLNFIVSIVTALAVGLMLGRGMHAVLQIFGVWAALSGLFQLATGVRRWKSYGAQWAMILTSLIHDARFRDRSGHLLPLAVLRGRPASLAFVSPHSD